MESTKKMQKKQEFMVNNVLVMAGYGSRVNRNDGLVQFDYRGQKVKSPFIDLSTLEKSDDLEKFLKEQLSKNNLTKQNEIIIILDIHGSILNNEHIISYKSEFAIKTDEFINVLDKVLKDLKMPKSKLILFSCYAEHVFKSKNLKLDNIEEVITADNSRNISLNSATIYHLIATSDIKQSLDRFYRKHMALRKDNTIHKHKDIKTTEYEERLKKLKKNDNKQNYNKEIRSIIVSIRIQLRDNFVKYQQKLNKFGDSDIVQKTITLLYKIMEIDRKYPELKLIHHINRTKNTSNDELKKHFINELVIRLEEKLEENNNKVTADKIQAIKDTQKIIDIIYTNKPEKDDLYCKTKLDLLKQELILHAQELQDCQTQSESSTKKLVRSNLLPLLHYDINRFKDQGAAQFEFIMMIIKFDAQYQIGISKSNMELVYNNNKASLTKYFNECFNDSLLNGSYEKIKDIKQAMEVLYPKEELKKDNTYENVVNKLSKMEDQVSSKIDQQQKAITVSNIKGVDEASIMNVMIQTKSILKEEKQDKKQTLNKKRSIRSYNDDEEVQERQPGKIKCTKQGTNLDNQNNCMEIEPEIQKK